MIVVTKFAVKLSGSLPSNEWIETRLELMRRFTAPSLAAQTRPHFRWIILLDEELKNFVPAVISASLDLGEVLLTQSATHWTDRLQMIGQAKERVSKSVRLDSDDVVRPDFLELAEFWLEKFRVINFLHGSRLNTETGTAVRFLEKAGPFLALQSPSGELAPNLGHHKRVWMKRRVVSIMTEQPVWLQTVNGSNISNRLRPWHAPFDSVMLASNFPTLPDLSAVSGEAVKPAPNFMWRVASGAHRLFHAGFASISGGMVVSN